jgi:hypothetical protein
MKYGVMLLRAALPFPLSSEASKPDQGNTVESMCGQVTDSVSLATRSAKESQESRDSVFRMKEDELRVLKIYKTHHLEENAETH